MFANFSRRPIAQQLILATIAALFVVFSLMAFVVQNRADSAAIAVTERNLEHEAKLMAGMLDSIFEAVKIRGEEESQFLPSLLAVNPSWAAAPSRPAMLIYPSSSLAAKLSMAMSACSRLFAN